MYITITFAIVVNLRAARPLSFEKEWSSCTQDDHSDQSGRRARRTTTLSQTGVVVLRDRRSSPVSCECMLHGGYGYGHARVGG